MADDLRAIGMRPSSAPLSVSDLRGLVSGSCSASHLFVNLDAFEDIEDGIDQLMALRTAVRNMTVILCSAHIRGDDLGSERSALCDVTLKLPVAETRLRAGLRAARENRQDMRFE
ncbi:MAG: hypothetical protein JJU19_15625 [Pararhodobacter sp.]|nr:hypothetical protein [Pararhodobacter sp.]